MISSFSFKIGAGIGKYPVDIKITDTILGVGEVITLTCHAQTYNSGFCQNKELSTLSLGNEIAVSDGDIVTVSFKEPVFIKIA